MNQGLSEHYYGDTIRTLYVVAGLIMVVCYPFFRSLISVPLSFAIAGSIGLAVFGGLMNPRQKGVIYINIIIPIVAFVFFQSRAVYTYSNLPPSVEINIAFFWVNEVLSVIFFFAAYLSTKTFRGAMLDKKD